MGKAVRLEHACLRTIEQRAAAANKTVKTKNKQTNATPEKDTTSSATTQNTRRIHVCATSGKFLLASEPARPRFHWAIFSLVVPVTFGQTTACGSQSMTFSATINFAMKHSPLFCRLATFPLILDCSRPLLGIDIDSSHAIQETPLGLLSEVSWLFPPLRTCLWSSLIADLIFQPTMYGQVPAE